MNDQQIQRSEKIASGLMRALAIVGVIAALALVAWLVVQGIRVLPQTGNGVTAAVSAVRSVFSTAPHENITFALDTRTLASGEPTFVRWDYVGADEDTEFVFSYACEENLTIGINGAYGWTDVTCDTPFTTDESELQIVLVSAAERFLDAELKVQKGDLEDTTIVTVVNTDISSDSTKAGEALTTMVNEQPADEDEHTASVPESTTPMEEGAVTTAPQTTSSDGNTVIRTTRPIATGPADIVVNIVETGVLVPVEGENHFFPVSPIPSNKTAAVTFTVANRGGEPSGAWVFIANLPIEGDNDYRYVSPAQPSLTSGMQVEFTLGFDEVLREDSGTIKIELVPTDANDRSANNIDVVKISIKKD